MINDLEGTFQLLTDFLTKSCRLIFYVFLFSVKQKALLGKNKAQNAL